MNELEQEVQAFHDEENEEFKNVVYYPLIPVEYSIVKKIIPQGDTYYDQLKNIYHKLNKAEKGHLMLINSGDFNKPDKMDLNQFVITSCKDYFKTYVGFMLKYEALIFNIFYYNLLNFDKLPTIYIIDCKAYKEELAYFLKRSYSDSRYFGVMAYPDGLKGYDNDITEFFDKLNIPSKVSTFKKKGIYQVLKDIHKALREKNGYELIPSSIRHSCLFKKEQAIDLNSLGIEIDE